MGRQVAWLAKQVEAGLAEVDLSVPQYRLLAALADAPEAPSNLACRLGVRPPSVTALVDGLVGRGLVSRRPQTGDRRRVSHDLTDAGRSALALADRATEQRLQALVAGLPAGRAAAAFDGLTAWGEAMLLARRGVGR